MQRARVPSNALRISVSFNDLDFWIRRPASWYQPVTRRVPIPSPPRSCSPFQDSRLLLLRAPRPRKRALDHSLTHVVVYPKYGWMGSLGAGSRRRLSVLTTRARRLGSPAPAGALRVLFPPSTQPANRQCHISMTPYTPPHLPGSTGETVTGACQNRKLQGTHARLPQPAATPLPWTRRPCMPPPVPQAAPHGWHAAGLRPHPRAGCKRRRASVRRMHQSPAPGTSPIGMQPRRRRRAPGPHPEGPILLEHHCQSLRAAPETRRCRQLRHPLHRCCHWPSLPPPAVAPSICRQAIASQVPAEALPRRPLHSLVLKLLQLPPRQCRPPAWLACCRYRSCYLPPWPVPELPPHLVPAQLHPPRLLIQRHKVTPGPVVCTVSEATRAAAASFGAHGPP
jgi:hypothetical protein